MSEGLNAAERFIFQLCRSSFLRLWSYANPQGKDPGKELCDVLVVCPPDVIIFSVKDVALKHGSRPEVGWSRWRKKAVEDSAKQIYGAERHIRSVTHVIRSDGSSGLALPKPPELRVHRVAVAAGSRGEVPIPFGDFGKGFVHVFDEIGAQTLLSELDTVTDFISYLIAKENFCRHVRPMIQREEDLLAIFLHGNRRFPDEGCDVLILEDDLWDAFMKRPEVAAKQEADKVSYVWDGLIDAFARDILGNHLEPGASPTDAEWALRVMARENRLYRRILGEVFKEFLKESAARAHAKLLQAPSGVVYVFLAHPRDASREHRKQDLQMRCLVAQGLHKESKTVVGIATEQYSPDGGHSMDIVVHHELEWCDELDRMSKKIQRDLGYFVTPGRTKHSYNEYPVAEGQSEGDDPAP